MAVDAKICGITTGDGMAAAISGGARFVGMVFFAPSPRNLSPAAAAALARLVPATVTRVGLFVDADDALLAAAAAAAKLDMVQLHGSETPARVAAIREQLELPAMKVIGVRDATDLDRAEPYYNVADWLMFDAKPPAEAPRPGGNALAFDWTLLAGADTPLPWMLAGGLDAGNVARAVRHSGACVVDVSSGVEVARGRKDPAKVRAFLDTVAQL